MGQTVLVVIILAVAAGILIHRLVRGLRGKSGCDCAFCPHEETEKRPATPGDTSGPREKS